MKKMEKKVLSITLVMIMLVAMLIPTSSSATTGEVTINDRKLKEAILTQNDVDTNHDGIITEEEMKNVERITIPESVTDLTGLEYAINLEIITIKYNEMMPDLSKINSVSNNLNVYVDVSGATSTVNLDFLKSVRKLSGVMIYKPYTEEPVNINYSTLSEIKTLNYLSLGDNTAPKSIKELGNVSYLLELDIGGEIDNDNNTIDLDGIEKLTNLTSLSLVGHNLQNVSKLGELKNLAELHLYNVKGVPDLSVLDNCNELRYVSISATDLSSLAFLKNKRFLETLIIVDSPVTDIKDMKDLINLVDTLPNLKELYVDLEGIQIESLEQYKEMQKFLSTDEPEKEDSNTENTEKTPTETKTDPKIETKKQAEKPTVIPQAGINVVGGAISILVAISVAILAVVFIKANRK